MGNIQNYITILKGNLRYKGASERLISLPVEFVGDRKQLIDADRTRNVNAAEQTEVERQASTTFRIGGKISNIFSNIIFFNLNSKAFSLRLKPPHNSLHVLPDDIDFNNLDSISITYDVIDNRFIKISNHIRCINIYYNLFVNRETVNIKKN